MEALGCSHLTFLTCSVAQSRQETRFLLHEKRVRYGSSLAVTFQQKCIPPISASSHQVSTNDGGEEIQRMHSDQRNNVRVRFKLQKECGFGQQFLIVGDDPILGLWDPSDGVPLIWSKGHVWTAEIDIPGSKAIKYKLILKGDSENITWQPGPDRILVTLYTDKTLTVFEDWDNPGLQNIVEEEIAADVKDESLIDSDSLLVIENLNQPILDRETDAINELANVHGLKDVVEKPFAENVITEELRGGDLSSSDKEYHTLDDKGNERKSEDILDEGVISVLVRGLIPMPSGETEEAGLEQVENESVERRLIDGIEDSTETKVIIA
ncbi:hypothetical protein OROHE_023871 [Orobanche hederae]